MSELGPVLPALLDALTAAGIGGVVVRWRESKPEKMYANAPAVDRLGYEPEEWVAGPQWATIAPEFRERAAQIFNRYARGESLPPAIEIPMLHTKLASVRLFSRCRCSLARSSTTMYPLRPTASACASRSATATHASKSA